MSRTPIIIDKCFLQGTSAREIQELSGQFQLLMPDVLFYELISSSEPGRSRCFKKLPQRSNPIPIAKHVGALLQKELATHAAAGLPSDNVEEFDYRFNPALSTGSYRFSEDDVRASREIEEELRSDILSLVEKAQMVPTMFPVIDSGGGEERRRHKTEIEEFVASDTKELRRFLSSLQLPGNIPMPNKNSLGPSWALFRWLQVHLLFSIDVHMRYGAIDFQSLTPKQLVKLEHDVLDAHYLILGVMQHAFATKENKLIRFFRLLCPDGVLVTS